MENFVGWQQKIYPLSAEGIDLLLQHMEEISFRKGEQVVSEGGRNDYVYFVKEGFARVYIAREGKDITLWFTAGGGMLVGGANRISAVSSEAMENSVLLRVSYQRLESLFECSLELANWGRKLMEYYLEEYENYFTRYSWTDAKAQYECLIREYPYLLQKMPLKHIASYLQITPQSLSRIRASKK